MSGTNQAPPVGIHMLTQLVLSIGLPTLILPLLATAAYFVIRNYQKRKAALEDIEQGEFILNSKDLRSGSDELDPNMTPATPVNSVHVPRAL